MGASGMNLRLDTGHKLSALLHGGLILWVLLADMLAGRATLPTPAVTEVALLSAAEFAALSAPAAPPAAPPPSAPEAQAIRPPEPVPPQPPPEPARVPAPPAPPPPPPPVAETPVPPEAPPAPPQAAVVGPVLAPDASIRPQQRSQSQRVAPQDAPEPPPEARVAPQAQPAPASQPAADAAPAPAPAPIAPPAAVTETVTEATRIVPDEPARRTATAPEVSLRPAPRPQRPAATAPAATSAAPAQPARPVPPAQPAAPPPAPAQPAAPPRDAVAEALAEALSQGLAGALAPAGPAGALTQSDMDGLRLAVESCWNVGLMPSDAFATVVTIAFQLDQSARPISDTIRLVQATGGSAAGQEAAFRAGRAAIIDCGGQGYGLPPDLFDLWREVEITFNPSLMGSR
jgi:hypothetical protein